MLCVQFPVPPTIFNISLSSTRNNKPLPSINVNNNTHYYSSGLLIIKPRLADLKKKCAAYSDQTNNKKIIKSGDEIQLTHGLDPELMPKHIAVIMDGNRRWARNRGLPVQLGHRAGGQVMTQLALNCKKFGVEVLTVFAFSTENWIRPKEEVEFFMNLFEEVIQSNNEELVRKDIRVSVVGNVCGLPQSLQRMIPSSEERIKDNKGSHLVTALNYSGRYDITEATKEIARKVKDGLLGVEDINEALFEQHLQTNVIDSFPNPDLLIRTSGELRLSNFMLWQLAYTELLFVDKLFPDFNEADLVQALTEFQKRQRRSGGHKY